MTTKTHSLLSFCVCFFCTACIVTNSLPLISFLHGPSDETKALDQQQSARTEVSALATQSNYGWPWEANETADRVLAFYHGVGYQDQRALVLRDAGIISALFTLILVLAPNFMSISYSASQRLRFLLLALPLYITPGLFGQVVFQKTVPIEMLMLQSWGAAKGLSYVGYCSGRDLLIGSENLQSTFLSLIHNVSVTVSSYFLVSTVLGSGWD